MSKIKQGLVGIRANPFYSVLIREKGFTLLEIMVALIILSVALLGMLRVMTVGLKGSKRAEETTIATMLAQRKIEELRSGTWASLTSESKTTFPSPDANFQWETTVTNPTANLKGVSLSVWWPAGASSQRCVGIETYIADHS